MERNLIYSVRGWKWGKGGGGGLTWKGVNEIQVIFLQRINRLVHVRLRYCDSNSRNIQSYDVFPLRLCLKYIILSLELIIEQLQITQASNKGNSIFFLHPNIREFIRNLLDRRSILFHLLKL